jgi:hypothetical protein
MTSEQYWQSMALAQAALAALRADNRALRALVAKAEAAGVIEAPTAAPMAISRPGECPR